MKYFIATGGIVKIKRSFMKLLAVVVGDVETTLAQVPVLISIMLVQYIIHCI